MIVYRVAPPRHAADLSGEGARLAGGRWNSKGCPMLYATEQPALSMLEYLAHFEVSISPTDLMLVELTLPDPLTIEAPDVADLPADWMSRPIMPSSIAFGDTWAASNRTPVLKLPSVMVPIGFGSSILLNPRHPDFTAAPPKIKLIPWPLDNRLAK